MMSRLWQRGVWTAGLVGLALLLSLPALGLHGHGAEGGEGGGNVGGKGKACAACVLAHSLVATATMPVDVVDVAPPCLPVEPACEAVRAGAELAGSSQRGPPAVS